MAEVDGVAYLQVGVDWPNVVPMSLASVSDDGLGSGIDVSATQVIIFERLR